jgi:hypothetical protein
MKKFLSENWYKLLIGSSFFMFSLGFMVQSISPAVAFNPVKDIKDFRNTGDMYVSGCGIQNGFAYLVDFRVNGRNTYYKIPLDRFQTLSDTGVPYRD